MTTGAYRVCMIPKVLLYRRGPHSRYVNVPAIYGMPAGRIHGKASLVRSSIHDLHLCEAYPLLVARCGRNTRDHHELNQLVRFECQFPPLCLF
jgi:hypothetical protein